MSTTFSPKAHLAGLFPYVQGLLVKDSHAVDEGKAHVSPGGVARPAVLLTAECGWVNHVMATRLETGAFPATRTDEERDAFYAGFDTPAKSVAYLEQETAHLVAAIHAFDDAEWGTVVDTPIGQQMSLFGLIEFAAMHMMYHDGQLNYIHTLHGDDKMHW